MRPSLVILGAHVSAHAGAPPDDQMIRVAAATELIHMATLMHDDLIDGAEKRRGRVTANQFWGNHVSVLSGDYMLARAFAILAHDGEVPVMQVISKATIEMAEGEIRQIELLGDIAGLSREYLSIIGGKTAAFMSACSRSGAICSGAPRDVEDALAEYGFNVGLAFQITDDLLDLIGDPALTGKPIGGDIREGKVTMPVIIALQRVTPDDRRLLEHILSSGETSPSDMAFVRKAVEETGAIEATRESASEYIARALESIRPLPQSPYHDSLTLLAEGILSRRK
jgi:octaprenyl-diphosphate synthase